MEKKKNLIVLKMIVVFLIASYAHNHMADQFIRIVLLDGPKGMICNTQVLSVSPRDTLFYRIIRAFPLLSVHVIKATTIR